jgi:hypothetical protein
LVTTKIVRIFTALKNNGYGHIEIKGDRWEVEQELLELIYTEMVENGEEFRIFTKQENDDLPF